MVIATRTKQRVSDKIFAQNVRNADLLVNMDLLSTAKRLVASCWAGGFVWNLCCHDCPQPACWSLGDIACDGVGDWVVSVGDGTTLTLHLTNLLLLDPTENEALRKNSEFKLAFGFRKRNWRKYQLAAERVTVENVGARKLYETVGKSRSKLVSFHLAPLRTSDSTTDLKEDVA